MATSRPDESENIVLVERIGIAPRHRFWLLVLGTLLIIGGILAIAVAPYLVGIKLMRFLGLLLLIGGVVQAIDGLLRRRGKAFLLSLLAGILYFVAGLIFLRRPGLALEVVTLVIAMLLMVGGLFWAISSVVSRFEGWGWALIHGLVSLALGLFIWFQWPWSGLWVVGVFIGIEMILAGWTLLMLWLASRRVRAVGAVQVRH